MDYNINDLGVQAYYKFKDINNRNVVISINENNGKKRNPFGLLAPMGAAAENPSSIPLVMLHDFYFVRKNHTNIEIIIDGRKHQPDELPLPMDWMKMLFTRYSPKPLIVTLNPAVNNPLIPLEVELQQK
ncbi:hypothetical protein RH915_10335 [Serpentinicella sp. ANB-PHB4]|uniref:hypothetical protein n=1 Tax=Serpentinicella sp. ANB-PHB4 TaxID=3074076 RepID=UPI00285E2F23|nr:hypothetical protein [Serpentinicella sp. ANB-PHB4]MDR5659886.1 hypothetical protein [Serpentinicella sp. ANB-PHB4]